MRMGGQRPGRFTPGKESRYPLYRRLGGPQGRSAGVPKVWRWDSSVYIVALLEIYTEMKENDQSVLYLVQFQYYTLPRQLLESNCSIKEFRTIAKSM